MSDIVPQNPQLKQCKQCQEWYPATTQYFYVRSSVKSGLDGTCAKCNRQRYRDTYPTKPVDEIPPDHKRCTACKEIFPATPEYFWRAKNGLYGLVGRCKTCDKAVHAHHADSRKAKKREWYQANREAVLKRVRANAQRRRELRKAGLLAYPKRHSVKQEGQPKKRQQTVKRQRDHVHVNALNRSYYAANRARYRENARKKRAKESYKEMRRRYQFSETYKSSMRIAQHRRRLRTNGKERFTPQDVREQYKRQKGKCYWCQCTVGKTYHIDHIVPLSRGGTNEPSNIVIACPSCNLRKGNKLPHEWSPGNRLL